jgi:type I restriction-modification system DNA methylase subunit
MMKLNQQQLEAHLWGAANILRGKTAGQDYKNYILSLMFYKRLCDQWENEADDAIAELERQTGALVHRGPEGRLPRPRRASLFDPGRQPLGRRPGRIGESG